MKPLVTVVTATWGRPRTLVNQAIPCIAAQTYPNIQHIIVTDGYDEKLNQACREAGYTEGDMMKRLVPLGRNWTGFSGDGAIGAVPRNLGAFLAAGDYLCYLDDDDEWLPHHIESLAAVLDSGHDLVCAPWTTQQHGMQEINQGRPPGVGRTGTSMFMHRAELLKISSWQLDGYSGDGLLVERWIAHGIRWKWVTDPTVIYAGCHKGAPERAVAE